jgi:putative sigma-54 modulation protein
MQINLTGHHIDITPALRNYVNEKLDKLARHFDGVGNVHVVLAVEKMVQKAEAKVHVSGADLFADAENENMYAAIDALADKLDRQVIKHKEKRKDHRGRNKGFPVQEEALDSVQDAIEPD